MTDTFDSAVRAAELLARCLKTGVRPRQHVLVTPIVWPPTGTGTRDGPMRALEDAARRMEKDVPGVLAVNVVGGYAFSDVPRCRRRLQHHHRRRRRGGARLRCANWPRSPGTCAQGGIPKQHDLDRGGARFQAPTRQRARCCWSSPPTISAAARRATAPM